MSIENQQPEIQIKEPQRTAFLAGRTAIIEALGDHAVTENILDVVALIAFSIITLNGKADHFTSSHDLKKFCDDLSDLVNLTKENKSKTIQ